MEEFWRNTVDQAQTYGPQLIKAALVMIAFIIGAYIVRWLIAAAIDRTGLAKKANASTATSDSKSLGASLAQAAFWVTILIGLMQALAIAGATQISSALHGVIDPILAYLPKVIGAALLFGIFLIIANVVRETLKAVLVFCDGMPERFGLATGPVNISGIVASVAFAVLIIIGAIMAFDVLAIEAISSPANALLTDIIGIIPNVLAAGVILAIFVLIGRFVSNLVMKTLPGTGVDSAVSELGLLKGADSGLTASAVISRVSMFLIVLLGLVAALNVLGIESLTYAMNVVLDMGVQIIFGALIIFAGVFIARLVSSAMDSAGAGATDVAARVMKWIIIILSVILGISRMGLDPTGGVFILDVAKWMVIGAAGAFAIAFGWGGRDWAARILESWRSTR
ncbi:mechanosensitive ion channel [Hyphomonas sp.]|uniref:mechanosensitive ion channel n=1 Tax=Hyphomonas sp. TaxID=87 RepID=UPI0025BDF1CD|nr:mechanosensitive ion channel [Hyphomonas sp.]